MGSVAGQAIFFHCRMLEEEWSALFCVAAPALHIHCLLLDHSLAHGTMRIMAAGAGDLAFGNRVVRRLVDLRPGLLVTTDASFVFELPIGCFKGADGGFALRDCDGGSARRRGMHRVAVIAAYIVAPMPPRFPKGKMPVAGMTAHASLSLLCCRDGPLIEADRVRILCRVACMIGIDAVASRTSLPASDRRARITLYTMLGFHYARLLFVTPQAFLLRISLRKSGSVRNGKGTNEKQKTNSKQNHIETPNHALGSVRLDAAYCPALSDPEGESEFLNRRDSCVGHVNLLPGYQLPCN